MRLLMLIGALLVSGAAAPAVAGPLEDADAAYDRGDYATALRLWRPLAEQGYANAQFALGIVYANGQGVPQDYAAAVLWFRMAAKQGDDRAQFNLGTMYDKGKGVPQNYATAVSWYREAAEQGHVKAQFNLGTMYDNGEGVPQDYVQAHVWFNLSAAQGDANATKSRDIVAAKMTPAQIAEAQRLAREWRPKR